MVSIERIELVLYVPNVVAANVQLKTIFRKALNQKAPLDSGASWLKLKN